jgi:beta-1,4-mannosyl-glycoprotein beta-1,4-N-acetylglucosaminyltransferase
MNTKKIIDVFLFCNELDMLELRLTEHEEVDLFILVESRKTFTNKNKPLNYEENKDRYKKWHHKIIYVVIEEYDDTLKYAWDIERYTRNYALDHLENDLIEKGILSDDTLIISSDLDEIVNNDVIKKCKSLEFDDAKILLMDMYYYNCNWKINTFWNRAKIIDYKSLKTLYGGKLDTIRYKDNFEVVSKAGWHLSYFLTVEDISYKLGSFSHTELNNQTFNNLENIKYALENGKDLFNRHDNILVQSTNLDVLPKHISVLPKMFQRNINPSESDYIYTNTWFEDQRIFHEKFLGTMDSKNSPIKILEIGSHEGRSSVFFSRFLEHKESTLTCIDPFLGEDVTTPVNSRTFQLYTHNISLTGKGSQIRLEKKYSGQALMELFLKKETFDYILIDGSHLTKDVIVDAVLSYKLLKSGGILFFDDYMGGDIHSLTYPKIAIDSFVNCYKNCIEILHVGYHYVVKKL